MKNKSFLKFDLAYTANNVKLMSGRKKRREVQLGFLFKRSGIEVLSLSTSRSQSLQTCICTNCRKSKTCSCHGVASTHHPGCTFPNSATAPHHSGDPPAIPWHRLSRSGTPSLQPPLPQARLKTPFTAYPRLKDTNTAIMTRAQQTISIAMILTSVRLSTPGTRL